MTSGLVVHWHDINFAVAECRRSPERCLKNTKKHRKRSKLDGRVSARKLEGSLQWGWVQARQNNQTGQGPVRGVRLTGRKTCKPLVAVAVPERQWNSR